MTITERWQQQIPDTLALFVQRASETKDIDFTTGILPVGVLWPIRQPVQEYDGDAADAVRDIVGDGAGRILKLSAAWPDDPVVAARTLAEQVAGDTDLRDALNRLTEHFDAARLFAEQFTRIYVPQAEKTTFNIDDIKAAVVNVGGVTNIESLIVHLNLPPLSDPGAKTQRKLWYIVTPVILLSAMLVIYQFAAPFFAPIPQMTGDFNVAVAEFGGIDEQGNIISDPVASQFSHSLYDGLEDQLSQITAYQIQVLPPDQTGWIAGNTREKRAQAAQQLAEEVNADVVVYGNLTLEEDTSNFIPEFYLMTEKLQDAEELAGQYEFGSPIAGGANIENPVVRRDMRAQLVSRTDALAQFVIGMGYYMLHRYDEAEQHFLLAANEEGWDDRDGKEVLYLFLGNTSGQQHKQSAAADYYETALDLEPEYARARLGVAEMIFHDSRGDCQPRTVDVEGLQEAIEGYQSALDADIQPALAHIETKTNFGLGRSYMCLSLALVDDYWSEAEESFERVIADIEHIEEHGDEPGDYLKDLAAESYGFLAIIYMPNRDASASQADAKFRQAATAYEAAIELLRDDPDRDERRGILYGNLGYVYLQLQEYDAAEQSYEQALEFDTDPERQERYQNELSQVQQERDGANDETSSPPQKD
jgi:tetratricopeptide (TPR) repeat protein